MSEKLKTPSIAEAVVVEKAAEARENDQERKMQQKAAGDSVASTCYPLMYFFFQQQNFAMGSLAQISSGAIGCSFNTIPDKVPEGAGADTL